MATGSAEALVLVVDDDPRSLKLMTIVFGKAGYRVVTAEDATRGLEALREQRPDAVLVDLLMPGIDGLEFCRQARVARGAGELVLALFTAMASDEIRRMAIAAGADEVFVKPFDRSELLARLADLLGRVGNAGSDGSGVHSGTL
jgi:DNA-binding response OmpR family regulator